MGRPDGSLADEQFEKLEALVRRTRGYGALVVLVDLPLPAWHRARSPYFQDYQRRKGPLLARLTAVEGVTILDLQSAYTDESGFRDSAHPTPAAARLWSQTVALALRDSLH